MTIRMEWYVEKRRPVPIIMVRSNVKKRETATDRSYRGQRRSRTGLTVTRGRNDNDTLTIRWMSISNSRETLKQWKLKLKLIRSLVNHKGFIVDDIKLMFVRIIKKKKKKLWFLLCITCAVRFCELRPRAAGCEDLWQRDLGGDKVGKTLQTSNCLVSSSFALSSSIFCISCCCCTAIYCTIQRFFFLLPVYRIE